MTPDEIAELLAGRAAGDLDEVEAAQLQAAVTGDAALQAELARIDEIAADLQAIGDARRTAAPHGLEASVITAARRSGSAARGPLTRLLAAVIPTLLVVAVGVTAVRGPLPSRPGAEDVAQVFGLGDVEPITFAQGRTDVVLESAVVAHTWGTEVFLELDGLAPGESYDVELLTAGGTVSAGSFLGTGGVVDCVLNGAVLREDVMAVTVRNSSGVPVLTAPLT